jgi:hypothetical protein
MPRTELNVKLPHIDNLKYSTLELVSKNLIEHSSFNQSLSQENTKVYLKIESNKNMTPTITQVSNTYMNL